MTQDDPAAVDPSEAVKEAGARPVLARIGLQVAQRRSERSRFGPSSWSGGVSADKLTVWTKEQLPLSSGFDRSVSHQGAAHHAGP